jgi:hypothetical protein
MEPIHDVLKLRISPPERIETGENTGIHHNPKRERGILGQSCPNAKSQSLTDVSGWDRRKYATSKNHARVFQSLLSLKFGLSSSLNREQ